MYLKKLCLAANWYITTSVTRGNRDGTLVRALSSRQCGLVSYPSNVRRGLSLLLVVVPSARVFCRVFSVFLPLPPSSSLFLPLQKPTWPNSNFDLETEDEQLLCGGATAKSHLFIYFFVNVFFIYFIYHTYICYFEENVQSILMRNVVAVVQELLAD